MKDFFLDTLQSFVKSWWVFLVEKSERRDRGVGEASPGERAGPGFVRVLVGGTLLALFATGLYLLITVAT